MTVELTYLLWSALLAVLPALADAQSGSPQVSLVDALQGCRDQGLQVSYSSRRVQDWMQVAIGVGEDCDAESLDDLGHLIADIDAVGELAAEDRDHLVLPIDLDLVLA